MDRHFLLLLLLSGGTSAEDTQSLNITYINQQKSWIKAAEYCSQLNGDLESNITILQDLNEGSDIDVWTGKYESLTPWAYIYGCFDVYISNLNVHQVDTMDRYQCQKVCEDSTFFTVQDKRCFCINDEQDLKVNKCSCNHDNCFTVWKQYRDNSTQDETECLCIEATKCSDKKIVRQHAPCHVNYNVTCDNGITFGHQYAGQILGSKACYEKGSFITWYDDLFCESSELKNEHWTSARRDIHTFIHKRKYKLSNLKLQNCYKLEDGSSEKTECDEDRTFFCRFYHKDNGRTSSTRSYQTTVFPDDDGSGSTTVEITHQTSGFTEHDGTGKTSTGMTHETIAMVDDSAKYTGAIIGSLVAIIIIVTVVAAVLIYRRRLQSKPPKSNLVSNDDNYTTIKDDPNNSVSNPNYSFANPLETEDPILQTKHGNNLEYSSIMCSVQNCQTGDDNEKHHDERRISDNTPGSATYAKPLRKVNKEILNENDKYKGDENQTKHELYAVNGETSSNPLAQLVKEEENDPYNTNEDYDHLHNVKKKENPTFKVYDHLPMSMVSDPTYDHMHLNASTLSDDDYDHFTAKDGK